MSNVKRYASFIAEQQCLLKITGQIQDNNLFESEDPKITDKVIKMSGDPDISHVGSTKAGHHVYAHSETDRGEASTYVVHHPDGKMTSHHIDHGGELPSAKELSKPASFHNVHDLHPSVRKIMHQEMKDEGVGEHYDD